MVRMGKIEDPVPKQVRVLSLLLGTQIEHVVIVSEVLVAKAFHFSVRISVQLLRAKRGTARRDELVRDEGEV